MLLHCHGSDVLRVKGLLKVDGNSGPAVIHGVQHLVHPPDHLPAWPNDDHSSRVVFIVRGLSRRYRRALTWRVCAAGGRRDNRMSR
jgi:G3E family GTPase